MSEHVGKLESKWTAVNGLSLHARISVEPLPVHDVPVVLVHGLSVSSGYMVPTAVHLAPFYRVYAPDLPGYGKSNKPSHILTVPELSDALKAWMQTQGLQRAILVGNSLGCQTIVDFALRYPESITHAVLIGPTMDPKARSIHQEAWRLLLDMLREPLSLVPVIAREYTAAGLRRTIRTLRYAFQDRMEEHLPSVEIPTLVVRGSRDPIVPQRWAEEVAKLMPRSQLVVIPGAAHAVNFNSPRKLVDVIRDFLED